MLRQPGGGVRPDATDARRYVPRRELETLLATLGHNDAERAVDTALRDINELAAPGAGEIDFERSKYVL